MAIEFGKVRPLMAFDINPLRIEELRRGYDRTKEVSKQEFDFRKISLLLMIFPLHVFAMYL